MVQYSPPLDASFAALADPTRRAIVDRLGRGDAAISALAEGFEMSLTGVMKHVSVLEAAGLVTSEKLGRVRTCRLDPDGFADAERWISKRRAMWEGRLDRLGAFLDAHRNTPTTKGRRAPADRREK
jgi:DNA-binding transcriptional ArsR family regulator